MIFAVGEVGGSCQKSDGARADDTYATVTYVVRFGADTRRVDEKGGEGVQKRRERARSPSSPECGAAVTPRVPRSSTKIIALHPHAAALAARHETRTVYGAVRIEEPVRDKVRSDVEFPADARRPKRRMFNAQSNKIDWCRRVSDVDLFGFCPGLICRSVLSLIKLLHCYCTYLARNCVF